MILSDAVVAVEAWCRARRVGLAEATDWTPDDHDRIAGAAGVVATQQEWALVVERLGYPTREPVPYQPRPEWLPGPSRRAPNPAVAYRRSLGDCKACGEDVRWVTSPEATVVAVNLTGDRAGAEYVIDEDTLTAAPADPDTPDAERWAAHAPRCPRRARVRAEEKVTGDLQPRCVHCGAVIETVWPGSPDSHLSCPAPKRQIRGRVVWVERPRAPRRAA